MTLGIKVEELLSPIYYQDYLYLKRLKRRTMSGFYENNIYNVDSHADYGSYIPFLRELVFKKAQPTGF